jgi:hypothetical protein
MASWAQLVVMDGERSWGGEGRWEPRKGCEGNGQVPFLLAERAR